MKGIDSQAPYIGHTSENSETCKNDKITSLIFSSSLSVNSDRIVIPTNHFMSEVELRKMAIKIPAMEKCCRLYLSI